MTLDLTAIYRDLHTHPELSFQEHRTAGVVAEALTGLGFEVHTGIGGTGVAGVLANGAGPTVLLRADMDGLPVLEDTGLDYASTVRATDPDGTDVPVMHACGHDLHVTWLLGAAERLVADRTEWAGTLVLVFQPAEEVGTGADAMVRDGLYDRVPTPDIVLGQHVAPLPAGLVALHPGVAMAGSDSITVRVHGVGGHGSRPDVTVDPVLLAANITVRLQGIVSREVAADAPVVVTVGQLHAGTKHNIIPAEATLGLNVRTFDPDVRTKVLAAIERVVKGESITSGAPKEPEFTYRDPFPVTVNDLDASARTAAALRGVVGEQAVVDPGSATGSEDVGVLATAAGAPLVYWMVGGHDPALFDPAELAQGKFPTTVAANHSPQFAPSIEHGLAIGTETMVAAAREWLGSAPA